MLPWSRRHYRRTNSVPAGTLTERLSMRRRQLLALSVLAPFALVACRGEGDGEAGSGASGAADSTPNFTYSPEGYDGLTIELDRPAKRIAADFYSAAGLAQYGITPVAVFGFGQNESPGKAFDQEGVVADRGGQLGHRQQVA